jgi:ABC-type Fe3+/spermidine/putrescine transport system ATPase subunit
MLSVNEIWVDLDDKHVLQGASLGVGDREIVAVLGPSGSGKTTLLRAIAGLVEVQSGEIFWDGLNLDAVPTHQRGFGLMFQGFALFPHLTVAENVGFGLRMAHHSGEEIAAEVGAALEWVGMGDLGERDIESLSGGERQRVALARTLAPRPRLVMLDEPLGALDRNLREKLISETRDILEKRGVTAIVVTHDRDEAVRISDRLALMRDGVIVQSGTLTEILANPADDWVRAFLS